MNIVVTGFMGTGKTAISKRLARRLGWRFVDIDQFIEASAKMPIAQVFAQRGEAVFRRLERRWIRRAVREGHQVIATGGGAFVDPQNRALLRVTGPVICLTARPQVIFQRVKARLPSRPLLAGRRDVLATIRALLGQRAKAYAQADLTIDTSDCSIEEVVDRLWDRLSPYVCKSWQYLLDHTGELSERYGGKYVVVVDNRVIASGETHLKAFQKARLSERREAGIYYIPLPEESLIVL